MRGNSHVRFLEGLGGRKPPWPTRRCLDSMRQRIATAGLILLASCGLSALSWWLLVAAREDAVPRSLVYALNVPPALVGAAYGRSMHGSLFTAVMRDCECSPQEFFLSYFASAIPSYIILFSAVVFCTRRFRSRAHRAAPN